MPALAALGVALAASAAQPTLSDGSTQYRVTLNRNGTVLRAPGTIIYLGRGCDAYSPQHGRGRWEWANGGVLVVFPNRRIGFPRQELAADPQGRCRSRGAGARLARERTAVPR